jgi:hypothetical protein
MVCVGGEVSGVSVVCALGVPEGGVERFDAESVVVVAEGEEEV